MPIACSLPKLSSRFVHPSRSKPQPGHASKVLPSPSSLLSCFFHILYPCLLPSSLPACLPSSFAPSLPPPCLPAGRPSFLPPAHPSFRPSARSSVHPSILLSKCLFRLESTNVSGEQHTVFTCIHPSSTGGSSSRFRFLQYQCIVLNLIR